MRNNQESMRLTMMKIQLYYGLNTVVCGYITKFCISLVAHKSFMKSKCVCVCLAIQNLYLFKKTADSITPKLLPLVIK